MYYSENELIEILKKENIKSLKCETIPINNVIELYSNELQDLIEYIKENKISFLFYSYNYANKDYYLIDTNELLHDGDFSEIAYSDIKKQNEYINSIDFEQPAVLNAFCICNGFALIIKNYAPWLDNLISAKDFVADLKEKYKTVLENLKEKRQNEKQLLLEELKPLLLNNTDFALCTNQNLRRDFMQCFLAKKENQRFKYAFFDTNGYINKYEMCYFADLVYAIYKKNSKH